MPKIRFSHNYWKLKAFSPFFPKYTMPSHATLLEVFKTKTEELHKMFVNYDTVYYDEKSKKWKHYKLPKGEVIVLLFKSVMPGNFLFTTIRRYTPQKYGYYKRMRGKDFEIVIE